MKTSDLNAILEDDDGGNLTPQNCLRFSIPGPIQQVSLSCDEQVVALCQNRNVKLYSAAALLHCLETVTVNSPFSFTSY